MNTDDKGIHDGHRARMKCKLAAHGQRIFDTYELLEMLLYYVIPYKDTNPIAKRLLAAFGSLDGVLSASKEQLVTVCGIGERAADLIVTAGEMLLEGELSRYNRADNIFDDYRDTGEYLVEYFKNHEGLGVVALLLNGSMRLLDTVELYGVDFGTAAVRSRPFIDASLRSGATVVVFAHTRPHSALYPKPCDLETVKMMSMDLGNVGVRVAEHFVIAGSRYVGSSSVIVPRLSGDSEELNHFLDTKKEVSDE